MNDEGDNGEQDGLHGQFFRSLDPTLHPCLQIAGMDCHTYTAPPGFWDSIREVRDKFTASGSGAVIMGDCVDKYPTPMIQRFLEFRDAFCCADASYAGYGNSGIWQ